MIQIKTLLGMTLLATSGLLVSSPQGDGLTPRQLGLDDYYQGIFFAVMEGLYRDGVSSDAVDSLLVENDSGQPALFVYGCPICMPVLNAFVDYRRRGKLVGLKADRDTFGVGLAGEVEAACLSEDLAVRFATLEDLVAGWVERYLQDRRMTDEERQIWEEALAVRRKKGVSQLAPQTVGGRDFTQKGCAACDAANRGFEED